METYEKNTCGGCLYWKSDNPIGITGRCYNPDGFNDMLLFCNEERCYRAYKENTFINNINTLQS